MLAVIGAISGFGASLFIPHRYRARAVAEFLHPAGAPYEFYAAEAKSIFENASLLTLTNATLTDIVQRTEALKTRLIIDGAGGVVDSLRQDISITRNEARSSVTAVIEFEDDDRDTAESVASTLLAAFNDNARKSSPVGEDATRVLETPAVSPAGLTPALLTFEGTMAGLAVGGLLWIFALITRA
jgi:hypothetical protein